MCLETLLIMSLETCKWCSTLLQCVILAQLEYKEGFKHNAFF